MRGQQKGIGSLRYFFGNYALDTDRRELRRGADVVPTTPQVFDLLDYLIRNRGSEQHYQRTILSPVSA